MSAGALTEADRRAGWRTVVPEWQLERLDTKLGTVQCVAYLKQQNQCVGSVGACEDGPYPEYSRWVDLDSRRGALVRVRRSRNGHDELLREGYVAWNELANLSTLGALEIKHGPFDKKDPLLPERSAGRPARDPQPGEQVRLFA